MDEHNDQPEPVSGFDALFQQEHGGTRGETSDEFVSAILAALAAEHAKQSQPAPDVFVMITLTKDFPEPGKGALGFVAHSVDDQDGTDPRLVLGMLQGISDGLRATLIKEALMRGDLATILHWLAKPNDPGQN